MEKRVAVKTGGPVGTGADGSGPRKAKPHAPHCHWTRGHTIIDGLMTSHQEEVPAYPV